MGCSDAIPTRPKFEVIETKDLLNIEHFDWFYRLAILGY
jgi:hypothetical protein